MIELQHNFFIYDKATGRIKRRGSCSDPADAQIQPIDDTEAIFVGTIVDPKSFYIHNGEAVARPALSLIVSKTAIAANDTDEVVISALPDPITVNIDGTDHVVTGGSLTITSPMPGTYKVSIDQFPYMPWSVEITAQ